MTEFVSTVLASGEGRRIATLLVSRPPTNALSRQVYRELAEAVTELGARPEVSAVILYGGHEIFSAGEDMPERKTLTAEESAAAERAATDTLDALVQLPKPTVAAITGYALGAGLTLALAADWRVSGDNAKFGATEILAGRAPTGTGAARLARAIGQSKARDLVFSGRFVDAREALQLGLIDQMVAPDGVYDAAVAWAGRFTDYPAEVLAAAKRSFARDESAGADGR